MPESEDMVEDFSMPSDIFIGIISPHVISKADMGMPTPNRVKMAAIKKIPTIATLRIKRSLSSNCSILLVSVIRKIQRLVWAFSIPNDS